MVYLALFLVFLTVSLSTPNRVISDHYIIGLFCYGRKQKVVLRSIMAGKYLVTPPQPQRELPINHTCQWRL